jgi:hypothetical protein
MVRAGVVRLLVSDMPDPPASDQAEVVSGPLRRLQRPLELLLFTAADICARILAVPSGTTG